jgi:hypothetical protein
MSRQPTNEVEDWVHSDGAEPPSWVIRDHILALEAKLAEAVAALENARRDALEQAAKLFDGSRAFSNGERLMLEQCAAAIRALAQPKGAQP